MLILLPDRILRKLRNELRRARSNEIGGVLMGERVTANIFRVVDLSVQRLGGGFSWFIRHPTNHNKYIEKFFDRTNHEYVRFNYLGEWHSHPSFVPVPSHTDSRSMRHIIEGEEAPNFAVLMVVKLNAKKKIEASATMFLPTIAPYRVALRRDRAFEPWRIVPTVTPRSDRELFVF